MENNIGNQKIIDDYCIGHYDDIYRLCRKFFKVREDAEDARHDVIYKLHKNADNYKLPETPEDWEAFMYEVVHNKWLDYLKEKGRTILTVKEEEGLFVPYKEPFPLMKLITEANEFVHEHEYLFTKLELSLWDCMYRQMSLAEQELLLGVTRNYLYVMQSRLRTKIHNLMEPAAMR